MRVLRIIGWHSLYKTPYLPFKSADVIAYLNVCPRLDLRSLSNRRWSLCQVHLPDVWLGRPLRRAQKTLPFQTPITDTYVGTVNRYDSLSQQMTILKAAAS